jgi:hypothetical protein
VTLLVLLGLALLVVFGIGQTSVGATKLVKGHSVRSKNP